MRELTPDLLEESPTVIIGEIKADMEDAEA